MPMTPSEPTLLLVTDDATVRDRVTRATTSLARLDVCCGVEDAFDQLATAFVSIVIFDGQVGGTPPWQFAERLRRQHPGVELALLIGEDHDDDDALRAGWLLGVVPRDAGPGTMRSSIARVLESLAQTREIRELRASLQVLEQCRRLMPCLEAGRVYSVALDVALEMLPCNRGIAVFQRESVPMSNAVALRGLEEREAQRLRERLLEEKPLVGRVGDEIELLDAGPHLAALREAGVSVDRLLRVPLQGQQSEAGMLWLLEDGRRFEAQELDRLRTVKAYAETALENCERYHRAKERAFIDDVTEVYNARYLLATTENEIRRAERYETPLTVLFLDLDRFKLVNDQHGHLVGSQVLRSLSQLLLGCVRDVDTLARYGGDEFTILLVDTDHDAALSIAERIRHTVAEHVFEAGHDGSLRLTLSLGVGTYPQHGTDRSMLLDVADKAMYRAKSLGRNRTCSANELST